MQGKMPLSLPASQPPRPVAVNSRINTPPQTIVKRAIGRFIGHLMDVRVSDVPRQGSGLFVVSLLFQWCGSDSMVRSFRLQYPFESENRWSSSTD